MNVQVTCSCCGRTYERELTEVEEYNLKGRQMIGRKFGRAQDLFPNIPAWFRAGLLEGFCVCPECKEEE